MKNILYATLETLNSGMGKSLTFNFYNKKTVPSKIRREKASRSEAKRKRIMERKEKWKEESRCVQKELGQEKQNECSSTDLLSSSWGSTRVV